MLKRGFRSGASDHEVRLSMLKLADLVFRGAEESPPKVTIHIPRAPVVETTPTILSPGLGPKAGLKSKRPPKIGLPARAAGQPSPLASSVSNIKIPSVATPPISSPAEPAAESAAPPKPSLPKKGVAFVAPKAKVKIKPVDPKREKLLPQAQTGGMSTNDYRASRSALKKIQANKHARLFAQPVDPVRDNAPK